MWFPAPRYSGAAQSARGLTGAATICRPHDAFPAHRCVPHLYAFAIARLSGWNVFHILLYVASPSRSSTHVILPCHGCPDIISSWLPLEVALYFKMCLITIFIYLSSIR